MPHDSIGNVIEVGDRVSMTFVVKDINQAIERCNVTLEAIDSAGLDEYKPIVACNARLTRRLDKGETDA